MSMLWNPEHTDHTLHDLLHVLAEEYPLYETAGDANLCLQRIDSADLLRVTNKNGQWLVEYGRENMAARGIAHAFAGQECTEKNFFRTHGILFDCTRGNVITVKHFKFWLRRLALLGYNAAMIYVKDAYQLPDEPYFGYMRGAYSLEEMREIDEYAKKLKIEMLASIQTLGHVEPALRWPAYTAVKDTNDVLLVDEPKTYELIDKMLTFWSEALSSHKIHLGMDEAQNLGRGKFLDLHGYEDRFAIFNRHLDKVCSMCKAKKLKPIIWSDMYFRFANKNLDYYDTQTEIPAKVKQAIPESVQLSYWDYYHKDEETYIKMLNRTRALNDKDPVMASGIWTWGLHWTDYEKTFTTVRPCVSACKKTGTKDLFYTLWGDDGGYCDFNSAFAGLTWAAELAYNDTDDDKRVSGMFEAVCGTSYALQIACGDLTYRGKDGNGNPVGFSSCHLLWDDPLMGLVWNELPAFEPGFLDALLSQYKKIQTITGSHRDDVAAGNINYAWNVANVLTRKIELRYKLLDAYRKRDNKILREIATTDIPAVQEAIAGLLEVFRTQWLRSFKSYGLELMQIRLGGLLERYHELGRVIDELVSGKIDRIPELDVHHKPNGYFSGKYMQIATSGFFL